MYWCSLVIHWAWHYLDGKETIARELLHDNEHELLTVDTVTHIYAQIGVVLKYLQIFEMTSDSFSLASKKNRIQSGKSERKGRSSIKDNCWPLMIRDLKIAFDNNNFISSQEIQNRVLLLFMGTFGLRPASCLKINDAPGIKLKDITFDFIDNTLFIEISVVFHKSQTTSGGQPLRCPFNCTFRKQCLHCYILLFLELRKSFKKPILISLAEKNLSIKEERYDEYLFCFIDILGRIDPNRPLSYDCGARAINKVCGILQIPETLFSFRSLRKAPAVDMSLAIMNNLGIQANFDQIKKSLESKTNWKGDSCLNYIIFGEGENGEIQRTLDLFIQAVRRDPNVHAEDFHRFAADLKTDEYIDNNNKLVKIICDSLMNFWKGSNEIGNENGFYEIRRRNVQSELNSFIFKYKSNHVKSKSVIESSVIDLNEIVNFYTWPFLRMGDIGYECRACHVLLEFRYLKSCIAKNHNIQPVGFLNLHWKYINNPSNDEKMNIGALVDENQKLKDLLASHGIELPMNVL